MPITAAPNRKTRSRRLMRSDRSRAKVIAVKSRAAVVKRTAEYASGWKPWSRTYFVSVKLMLQMTMVTRSPTSAADRRRTAADASDTLGRGRGHPRRHRHARRAGDAALRVPAPRSSRGAREGPPGRPRGPPLRRREDGAARPARPRVLSRRGGARGASDEGRLGNDPERGSSVRPPASAQLIDSVLVTGGSRGVGKAIALRFAARGAKRVAIGYLRNDRAAEETAAELRAAGAEPVLVRGNVTSERVLEEVAALGPLDVLVHNAATGVIRPALETEPKHWEWTLTANARALLDLARVAAPEMPRGASIVAVSSLGSTRVLENYTLVGTSKAALESLVRYLAVELSPAGIRVNGVSAGVVETDALKHFPNREEMVEHSTKRTPVGRLVEPDDVADAVEFLCSPAAKMVCGQTLIVDGGFSLLA